MTCFMSLIDFKDVLRRKYYTEWTGWVTGVEMCLPACANNVQVLRHKQEKTCVTV